MNSADKPTKKKVIMIKLKNLQDKLSSFCKKDETIFPPIETIDIIDFLFYFNMIFPNGSDYTNTITNLILSKQILNNNDDINHVVELVLPFVHWLKKLH